MSRLSLRLTPHGRLIVEPAENTPEIDDAAAARLGPALPREAGHGLLRLGAGEVGQACRRFSSGGATSRPATWRAVPARVRHEAGDSASSRPAFRRRPTANFASLVLTAPMMAGAEYLTAGVSCAALWDEIGAARFAASLAAAKTDLQSFPEGAESGLEPGRSRAFQPGGEPPRPRRALRLHGDLHDAPLGPGEGAACAARPGAARIRRRGEPRQAAVAAAAGAARRRDLRLAASRWSMRARSFIPLRWTPREASRLLASVPELETCRRRRAHAAVVARQPSAAAAGDRRRSARRAPSALGLDGLLDFRMDVTLDGEPLTRAGDRRAARRHRRAGAAARPMGRGRSRAARTHDASSSARPRQLAEREGLTFAEAMRMLAGAAVDATMTPMPPPPTGRA